MDRGNFWSAICFARMKTFSPFQSFDSISGGEQMKKMFSLLLLGSFLALAWAAGAQNPDPLTGKWWTEEKDAQIEIYACEGKF